MTPIWNWIWILIPLLLALLFKPWLNKNKKLPPGPKGFPILGSLHLIKKLPHRDLHTLSKNYGPIMHMKLGLVNTIIVSSPESAELFLKTYDHIFTSRPLTNATKHLFYGQKNFGFAKYGPYWRNMRKMCTHELLSTQKVNSFKSMRKTELKLLVESLKEDAKSQTVVDLSSKVTSVVRDMTCLMVFGKRYVNVDLDERSFHAAVQEVVKLVVTPNLGDLIPFVARLDLQGLNRRAKRVSEVFDGFLERIVDEHLVSRNGMKCPDFVDVMLDLMEENNDEYQIDRLNIKALILEMIITAMDTTTTAIEWALPELIKHPKVMKKLQEELEKVVGLNRMVEESDLEHMEYLDMIVKETLRLHPPVPLLVPHESLEDCTINEFHIPKQSRIIINAWAIGQDPNVWIDPQNFFPERFVGRQIDVKGKDFQLIPFGSGRRGCPGIYLGLTVVRLVVAQLVHCFDWELPNNMLPIDLDMTEDFGLTCPRLQHLMVIPSYRLS